MHHEMHTEHGKQPLLSSLSHNEQVCQPLLHSSSTLMGRVWGLEKGAGASTAG